jgi:polyisoprenoid-binding protein YceI
MKTIARVALAALFLSLAPALALGQVSKWELDVPHSHASFVVSHMVVSKVRGEFGTMTGLVTLDEKDVTKSMVEVTIDVSTIDTRDPKRDGHLKSPDFFDVAKYPTITFKSKKVEKAGEGLKVTGDLTMHGVTKTVVLDAKWPATEIKDPWGKVRRGASATAKLDRQDYGVAWSKLIEGGGLVAGNEIAIEIELELIKQ